MTTTFRNSDHQVSSAFAADGVGPLVYGHYKAAGYAVNPLAAQVGAAFAPESATPFDAFTAAGLHWKAEQRAVHYDNGLHQSAPANAPNYRAIVRSDNGALLSIQSPSYTPVQNSQLMDVFCYLRDSTQIENILQIRDGKRIYITARITSGADAEIIPGDRIRRYLHIFNSHDGSTSFGAFFTDIRLSCANQLAYLQGTEFKNAVANGQGLRRRHTASVTDFAQQLPQLIDTERSIFRKSVEEYRSFADVRVTPEIARRVLEATFADKLAVPVRDTSSDDKKAKRPRTLDDLNKEIDLIRSHAFGTTGLGQDIPGVRGSLWGLYNAITQYATWDTGRAKDETERARGRLEALYGGAAADRIERARQACLALV